MSGLRLHPNYGVNATMPVCFFCGEPTGEIALLGASCKVEAPRSMVINKEPCATCQGNMDKGITLFEADHAPTRDDPFPVTGNFAVIKEAAVAQIFTPQSVVNAVLKARRALLDRDAYAKVTGSGRQKDGAK